MSFVFQQHSLGMVLLVLVCSLIIGSGLHCIIAFFPLWLKSRWHEESFRYLLLFHPYHKQDILLLKKTLSLSNRSLENIPFVCWFVRWYFPTQNCTYIFLSGVELVTMFVSMVLLFYRFQTPLHLFGASVFCYFLIILLFIDFRTYLLPDEFSLSLLWLGLFFNCYGVFVTLSYALIGAIAGYLFLWGMYWLGYLLLKRECLGYGDFKLLSALGAWLGWQVLPELILLASGLGLSVLLIRYIGGNHSVLNKPIAFGGYLALSGMIMLFRIISSQN